jgi:tetratricopeptide (TPR) repeat protein
MAEVYEVIDLRDTRRIALKRLMPQDEPEKRAKARRLFEREFQTLSQLSHPKIVEVYDYAVDETGPFYTMELLSGGDLSQMVPMDFRRACRLAKDVCSALSLLHSRSMVHRDVSPRNVRALADGSAKLIDFGAMAPFGRSRNGIVGTPAYCAPEVINGLPLDARSDLYALGATLYYALTATHAYPAKDFASLPERWQIACPLPSEYAPAVPPALDALVLELLRLDPLARPPSAFEVLARLCAIDGTSFDEHVGAAQAYLTTPTLVGRGAAVAAIQRKLHRTEKGRGRAVIVSGPTGVGRSRFLDAVALEAKLRGTTVVAADAADGAEGEYGAVRALVRRLAATAPERVAAAASETLSALAAVVPELAATPVDACASRENAPRAQVQQELREWFGRLVQQAPLVVMVDDAHAIDEPSAALLSLLAHDARNERLLVVAAVETGVAATAPAALKLFTEVAESIELSPLSPDDAEQLLRSVFGNGPNVGLLAHRLHGVSGGNPRDVMQLAGHLIDRKVIRYEQGVWTVPDAFDARDLPETMAQSLDARVASFSPGAREIACALSLAVGEKASFEELGSLLLEPGTARAAACVDELLRAHVLRATGESYMLTQEGWARALQSARSPDACRFLHLRLAKLFQSFRNDDFRQGKHLLRGGAVQHGLDVLARHAAESQEHTNQSAEEFFRYMQSLPADWLDVYEEAIRLCVEKGRPRRDAYALRSRLSGILAMTAVRDAPHSPALMAELAEYTGLTAFLAMDPSIDHGTRLKMAIGQATKRHAECAEDDRVIDPMLALRHLGRAAGQAAGVITSGIDVPYLHSLPSLLPFVPLSPVFGVVQLLLDGMLHRYAGRLENTREIYGRLIERLSAPDGGGMDASHNEYTRLGVMNGIAMIEAGMGLDSALDWASRLDPYPKGRVNALQVRMLYHLWQGNVEEARRLRYQVELLRIQDSPRQMFEGTHLLWQITAYGLSEDLTHIKETIDAIAGLAERHRGWRPVHHYGIGEYHRAGGAHDGALAEFEKALTLAAPGDHQIWPYLAGAHLRTLDELGRTRDALDVGRGYMAAAEKLGLGYVTTYIAMALALVEAKVGNKETAVGIADGAIEQLTSLGCRGLTLGVAYETRARIALVCADKPAYSRHLGLCRDIYTTRGNAALVTKFEKLRRSAHTVKKAPAPISGKAGFFTTAATIGTSRLDLCQGAESRANCALTMVMDQCGATAGVLYLVGAHGPFAAASFGKTDDDLGALALEYLMSEAADVETTGECTSITTGESKTDWSGAAGEKYRPVLLTHESPEGFLVTGVAVVALSPDSAFAYPSRVANEVSRHLRRMGDVTGMVVAG